MFQGIEHMAMCLFGDLYTLSWEGVIGEELLHQNFGKGVQDAIKKMDINRI